MPPSNSPNSTRVTESMLGMSPGEVRLLLLAHLSFEKKSGKMDIDKLATRAGITVPSARNMYRAALSKLAKLNPESDPAQGDAGASTGGPSPSTTPSRRGGRRPGRPGRPRKTKGSDTATATNASNTEPKDGEVESNDQAKVDEYELDMKDANEETGVGEDEV